MSNRTHPNREDADFVHEGFQEAQRGRAGQIHILNDRFAAVAGGAFRQFQESPTAVPAHDALVEARTQALTAQETPQQRMLSTEILRAPEPIGVPAPQIVFGGQIVLFKLAQRAVVDLLERIVAHLRCRGHEPRRAENEVVGRKHHAVDEIRVAVEAGVDGGEKLLRSAEPPMANVHVGLCGHRLDTQSRRVAQGAVAVWQAGKQVGVLVRGRTRDDAAIGQRHVCFAQRRVNQSVAKRRRLDADARHRAANGDGFQLRHHFRRHATWQHRRHQSIVGNHAFHVGAAVLHVHAQNIDEGGRWQAILGLVTIAKEVRERLVQTSRSAAALPTGARQSIGESSCAAFVSARFLARHPAARSAVAGASSSCRWARVIGKLSVSTLPLLKTI